MFLPHELQDVKDEGVIREGQSSEHSLLLYRYPFKPEFPYYSAYLATKTLLKILLEPPSSSTKISSPWLNHAKSRPYYEQETQGHKGRPTLLTLSIVTL